LNDWGDEVLFERRKERKGVVMGWVILVGGSYKVVNVVDCNEEVT